MDERTRELIALGASVTAHCQPCVKYHLGLARKLGVSEELIQEAVEIGRIVGKGAGSAMDDFLAETGLRFAEKDSCCSSGSCCSETGTTSSCCCQRG